MGAPANRMELFVQRRLHKQYLEAEPDLIELQRPTFQRTPTGGRRRIDPVVTLPSQLFRLVPFKRRLTQITRDTPDGDVIKLPYVLVGLWNADVQVYDEFEHLGKFYVVESIEPNRNIRTLCNLTYKGLADA